MRARRSRSRLAGRATVGHVGVEAQCSAIRCCAWCFVADACAPLDSIANSFNCPKYGPPTRASIRQSSVSCQVRKRKEMVYCSKCGTQNPDNATTCSNCGAPFQPATPQEQYGPYWRQRRYRGQYYSRRGSGWGALFAGIVIIIIGLTLLLSQIYKIEINWSAGWAIVIIVVGLWLLFVAFRRSRRYLPPQP